VKNAENSSDVLSFAKRLAQIFSGLNFNEKQAIVAGCLYPSESWGYQTPKEGKASYGASVGK